MTKLDQAIVRGSIYVEQSPFLPQALKLEGNPARPGWGLLAGSMDGAQFEKALANEGWSSFYVAGSIDATAFGFDKEKLAATALRRLIGNLKADRCNCVEIDRVMSSRLLGVASVTLVAHARRIQEDTTLRGR
jgi:hypothetical protein